MDEKTIRNTKIITVAAVTVFFILVLALLINIVSVVTLRVRRNRLQAEYDRLAAATAQMQDEINYKSSDAFIEQYAREILGMIRDGETVVVTA